MKKNNIILFHTLIPMILGAFIYVTFREKNLLMFSWFDSLGLYGVIDYLRLNFSKYNIPNWILFNYPDVDPTGVSVIYSVDVFINQQTGSKITALGPGTEGKKVGLEYGYYLFYYLFACCSWN